jgi:hypothetical protein
MTKLQWSPLRDFETGVDRGVVYLPTAAVPWNGLTDVEEDPSDATTESYYFDGIKTLDMVGGEIFAAHLTAYFAPEELDDYNDPFGLTYRTIRGDANKIHILYNVSMVPSSRGWTAADGRVNPSSFAWDLYTKPVGVTTLVPFAHLIVDTTEIHPDNLSYIEDTLYGSVSNDPNLPDPEEIIDFFGTNAIMTVVDHGDGTWTATGPDSMVHMLDATTFEIVSPTVNYLDPNTYNVRSY